MAEVIKISEEPKRHIEWDTVQKWIENNWFETDPKVSEDELNSMAIGIAGEIDKVINQKLNNLIAEIETQFEEIGDTKFDNGKDFKGQCTNLEIAKLYAKMCSVVEEIKEKSIKTVVSECVGDGPEGYIIMDKDFQELMDKWHIPHSETFSTHG